MDNVVKSMAATLNAKVGAISLCGGAIALHVLNQLEATLVPIRLIVLGIIILGAWAFSDEMGLTKPLNRAGIICFLFSMVVLAVTILEPVSTQHQLIYAFGLLSGMLLWSAAFLHRRRSLKVVGAFGSVMALVPLAVLIVGHISIAAGAFLGVEMLFNSSDDSQLIGTRPVNTIEAVFVLWYIATAVFLWRAKL